MADSGLVVPESLIQRKYTGVARTEMVSSTSGNFPLEVQANSEIV